MRHPFEAEVNAPMVLRDLATHTTRNLDSVPVDVDRKAMLDQGGWETNVQLNY